LCMSLFFVATTSGVTLSPPIKQRGFDHADFDPCDGGEISR
jgi:hypothetical protein